MDKKSEYVSSTEEVIALEQLLEKASGKIMETGAGFVHYGRKLDALGQRLSEGRFHLAVLGQFKRGKSTLLNALAGESILPMGVVPLTAAPTFIQYGETPGITVKFQAQGREERFDGSSTEEMCSWLADFVTESGNPENRRGVTEVEVDLPAPILSGGVVLIDTPGIGSTYRHNTRATLDFLQQCDAALFLVSADPPITETELEFLSEVREKVPRLFFVLNKIDYLNEQELEEVLSFYKQVLADGGFWNNESPVFCVSARMGLEAKQAGDSNRWAESGMGDLESFLVDFLAKEKFGALSDAISRRAADIIDAALMEAGIAVRALQLPRKELEDKIAVFEESLKRAERERMLIQDILEGDKKRITAFIEEQAAVLRGEAEAFLKDIMSSEGSSRGAGRLSKADIQQAWADALPDFFEKKRDELNERVKALLVDCLTPHEQRLADLIETLRRTAADLFHVPYKPLGGEDALEIKKRPYWVLNTWNTDPLPVLQSIYQRMEGLVRRNVENIRWSMLQNLNISIAGFARRVRERLDETVAATKGAMDVAHERRNAQDDNVDPEIDRIRQRMKELDEMKSGLASFHTVSATGGDRAEDRK